jgi:hypothetical protein
VNSIVTDSLSFLEMSSWEFSRIKFPRLRLSSNYPISFWSAYFPPGSLHGEGVKWWGSRVVESYPGLSSRAAPTNYQLSD